MSMIRIGTCSWKYDSWRGIIYSDEQKINYLKEYAAHFNTVEIDQWFWSLRKEGKVTLPKPQDAAAYKLSVPEQFRFTIKVPNSITLTHFYSKSKKEPLRPNPHFLSNELFNRFLFTLDPLKENIGCLMFQFEYLNKKKMPSQDEFQERLKLFFNNCTGKFNYAVEIRNPNYLNDKYAKFLAVQNLGYVYLQGYYMPNVYDVYEKLNRCDFTNSIIRLHGPDRKGIEEKSGGNWNRIIESKDDELNRIIEMALKISKGGNDIYINVNNHYEGSAPLTINKINTYLNT